MIKVNLDSLRLTLLPYFFFGIFWPLTRATCYYPNGIDMAETDITEPRSKYSPCNNKNGDEHNMCCARWDTCRFDGLCYSTWNGGSKEVFRDGCTDRTWKSPSCVKLCVEGTSSNRTTRVTPCNNGSYCCGVGTQADTCCDGNQGLFLLDGAGVSQNPIGFRSDALSKTSSIYPSSSTGSSSYPSSSTGSSSLSTSPIHSGARDTSAITTAPGSPSSTSTSSSASQSFNRVGVIVGGALGGVIILCLMLLTGLALIWRRRKRRNLQGPEIHEAGLYNEKTVRGGAVEVPGCDGSNELDAIRPPLELDDARMRPELHE